MSLPNWNNPRGRVWWTEYTVLCANASVLQSNRNAELTSTYWKRLPVHRIPVSREKYTSSKISSHTLQVATQIPYHGRTFIKLAAVVNTITEEDENYSYKLLHDSAIFRNYEIRSWKIAIDRRMTEEILTGTNQTEMLFHVKAILENSVPSDTMICLWSRSHWPTRQFLNEFEPNNGKWKLNLNVFSMNWNLFFIYRSSFVATCDKRSTHPWENELEWTWRQTVWTRRTVLLGELELFSRLRTEPRLHQTRLSDPLALLISIP